MVALLARWQHAWFVQQAQTAIRDEANRKATEANKIAADCKALAKSLGFDRDDKSWDTITAEFFPAALELYARVKTPDLPHWNWKPPAPPPPEVLAPPPPPPIEAVDDDDEFDETKDQFQPDEVAELSTTVREAVLTELKNLGPWGAKAAALRATYEKQHDTKLHSKTIGMTLYRLSKETPPLVRREGRTWFFVETKNPGAGAPGQNEADQ